MINLLENKTISILKFVKKPSEYYFFTNRKGWLIEFRENLIKKPELLIEGNVYVFIKEQDEYTLIYNVSDRIFYKSIDEIYGALLHNEKE